MLLAGMLSAAASRTPRGVKPKEDMTIMSKSEAGQRVRWGGVAIARRCALAAGGVLMLAAACAPTVRGESAFLVRVTDMKHESTYQVLTSAEFQDLRKTIDQETKRFPQALAAAAKDWRANPLNKNKIFPGPRLAARRADVLKQCANRDQADKELKAVEDRESKKQSRESERAAEEAKKNQGNATAGKAAKALEMAEKEKEMLLDQAVELVDAKLKELAGGEAKPGDAEAKPAEAPPDQPKGAAEPPPKPGAKPGAKPDPFKK